MAKKTDGVPNPKRVAAGRRNWLKWKGVTPAGRERLRQAALKNQPWRFSTGPRTPEGKARMSNNGRWRQKQDVSGRQVHRELSKELREVHELTAAILATRCLVYDQERVP